MRDQFIFIYSYLHGIWRYRWSALLISSVIAFAGWLGVYTLPNQYTAQAVMHVDTASVMKPLLRGLAVESNVNAGLGIVSRVILSRKNLEEIIRQTDLALQASSAGEMDRIVSAMQDAIVLKTSGGQKNNNNIYELSYTGDSPEIVYQIVSKLLNTLIESTLDSARTDTAAAQQFLDRQISEYENRLTLSEQKLAGFKRANVGFMPDEKGSYYNRLQAEQKQLEDVASSLKLTKRRYSEMVKQLEGEAPLLNNSSYGGSKVLKLRKYREELEQLLTQYEEQHPDVISLRAIIAGVIADDGSAEEYMDQGTGEDIEFNPVYQQLKADMFKAGVEVETLKITLMEQKNKVANLKQAVDVLPGVEAKLAKLNRDYEITRGRYLDLVTRRESARLAQEVGQSGSNINFRIIDSPRVPTKPSGPQRILLLTGVFIVAIGAGLAWGFLRYFLAPTFVDSSQLGEKIDLPVLGSVGLFISTQHQKQRRAQLTYFLMFFFVLVISYGGFVVFNEQGSELIGSLLALRSVDL